MGCLQSMTGFGRAENTSEVGTVTVEIKTVNHRYLDARIYLPRDLASLEIGLLNLTRERVGRGKLDAWVRWTPSPEAAPRARFHAEILRSYDDEVANIVRELGRRESVSLEYLLGLPGVADTETPAEGNEAVEELVRRTLLAAIEALLGERRREGAALCAELRERLAAMDALRAQVDGLRDAVPAAYRERLRKRAAEWAEMAGVQIDSGRLEAEVLLFAERADITEELARLAAHVEAFRKALDAEGEPQGKSMEFLTQELLRETNTIASKARDTGIATAVLTMKNEIEKIREQVMNIE